MAGNYVSSRVTLDMDAINRLINAQITALEQTAEAVHTDVLDAHVVPRKDGDLSGKGFFVDDSQSKNGHVELVHSAPYARRMYFHPEYKFHREPWVDDKGRQHDGNKNAQGKWLEPWISGRKSEFAKKTFCKLFRRIGGLDR